MEKIREFLAGTNGGVTLMGIIMSAAGGLAVGLAYYIALLFRLNSDILDASICQWPLILTGLFGGLIGSLIDSFLGATCQFSGNVQNFIEILKLGFLKTKYYIYCRN